LHVCDLTLLTPDVIGTNQQNTQPVIHAEYNTLALRKLIIRSRQRPVTAASYSRRQFELFNIVISDHDDLPLAAVMRLNDRPQRIDGCYMFADPVHLRADRDSIIMLGKEQLEIKASEADEIIAMINAHFRDDGIRLDLISGQHWCLSVPTVQKLHTFPLAEVIGQNIHPYLPYGEDSGYWRSILNEVQMLLSTCNFNQEREASGELTINSLWFWGCGPLPAHEKSPWTTVCSDDYLVEGLARHTGVYCERMPEDAYTWYDKAGAGKHLVVMGDNYISKQAGDGIERHKTITDMETRWFSPLLELLKTGRVSDLTIYLGVAGCYHITPLHARRWWRHIGKHRII